LRKSKLYLVNPDAFLFYFGVPAHVISAIKVYIYEIFAADWQLDLLMLLILVFAHVDGVHHPPLTPALSGKGS
jgi:membrane protein implicated in regulation of membrane protease activity